MNINRTIVFCDFDGTITAIETFTGMLKEFTPELAAILMPQMYARQLTLKEGVKQLLQSIPSRRYPEIIAYAQDKPIREGLWELLDFLASKRIPFVVISGGIQGMVEAVLNHQSEQEKSLMEKISAIHAVSLETTGEYLTVNSPCEGEIELLDKIGIMNQYRAEKTIAIGDSVTDINMALKADLVFARDRLIDYLEAENKPYIPWDNFFTIRDYLAAMQ